MIDCPNAEIRDRLPDLLHERLDAEARVAVLAHVSGCAACRAELELLRALRGAIVRETTVDVGRVTRVVVSTTTGTATVSAVRPLQRRRVWTDWRVAAAITVLAFGSASLVGRYRAGGVRDPMDSVRAPVAVGATTDARASGVRSPEPRIAAAPPAAATTELSMGGGVSDLSESDLEALLSELAELDGVPESEPEPVTVRVAPLPPGSSE